MQDALAVYKVLDTQKLLLHLKEPQYTKRAVKPHKRKNAETESIASENSETSASTWQGKIQNKRAKSSDANQGLIR